MSAYLEAVAQTREHRDQTQRADAQAQEAFVRALKLARQHHSLRACAKAAGLSFSGVKYLTEEGAHADV